MRAFSIPEISTTLTDPYPAAPLLRSALLALSGMDLYGLLRLWFSEGIPFAFRSNPILYEAIRDWLSLRLGVHPREITVIGSARIGYSVSPAPKYGNNFSAASDLDLSCISRSLFSEVVDAFVNWETDFEMNRVKPRNRREAGFWDDNLRLLQENIARGFIDPYKIPTWSRYPVSVKVQQALYVVGEKLKMTPHAPSFSRVSLRVYRDWEVFFRQLSLNASFTIRSLRGVRQLSAVSAQV